MVATGEFYTTAMVFGGTFTLTYLVVWWRNSKRSKQRCPPCLPSVPILGSMPFLTKIEELHEHFTKQANIVGKVFSLYLADRYVVVLNGREAIQEAFVKRSLDFASRTSFYLASMINPQRKGIGESPYNSDFKKFHQLSLSILKKFGFGQGIMERRIQMEVEDLYNEIGKFRGKAFNPSDVITRSVLNVISSIIFGKRFDLSDPTFKEMIRLVHGFVRDVKEPMVINFFPFLRFLPRYKKAIKHVVELDKAFSALFEEQIKKSLSGETEESFISCYVNEEGPDYDHQQLLYTLRDLFLAGTETTATTLQWFLVFMANNPEIQTRIQKEIDSIVPTSKLPSLEDKSQMPYVEATILELMRVKTLVPLSVPRLTTRDTEVNGYFIPANCMVFANLYSAHMNPEVWPEPEKFRPERFIDQSGSVINREMVIPFSLGKRSCLGEVLARQELFLFVTGLLHQFDIRPPEGQQTIEVHEQVLVTLSPSAYEVRLIRRN